MRRFTNINGRDIPVLGGDCIAITFAPGSPYQGDEGTWRFWTAFNHQGAVTARWKGEDPGERFRRMKGDPVHAEAWALACDAIALRPATQVEVESWLDIHPVESAFAGDYQVASKTGRVVNTPVGYRLD